MKHFTSRWPQRSIAAWVAVLLMIAFAFPCAASQGQRVLRVAFPQAEGFTMTGPDGKRYGLVVDFLNEVAKYTGWEYEYVDTGNELIIDDFLDGKFDLMGGTYYSAGFEENFAYPEYNCGYNQLVLYSRRNDDSIKKYDLRTLNGKTIGVYERNKENIRRLKEYLSINALDCTLKYYTYEQLSVSKDLKPFLRNGEVDLLLGNSTDVGDEFYQAVSFEAQAHYIVTTVGNQEVLDGLNMALERIYDADPNFAKKLYTANLSTDVNGKADLNAQELRYIEQKGAVTIALPKDWHPLFCVDNGDNHDGIVPDILKEATEFSGLEFSYLRCDSYAEALHRVQQGEADLLGFFVGTEEEALERGLALSSPYVELGSILVRNKKSSYPADGLTGAILQGRDMPVELGAKEVRSYSNTTDALSDVNCGKLDFFYGVSSHLEYIIQQENLTNVVQVNLVNDRLGISFAMTSPVQPELFTILNKTINNIQDEEKAAINSRNIVSIGESHLTLSSIVYANPGLAISVVALFLLLVLAAVLLVARSRLHAAAIRIDLEKAEANSRAKSDFLSKMSHEIRTPMNAIVGLTELTEGLESLPEQAKSNLSKIKASARYLLSLISDILDMSRIESGKMEIACMPFSLHALLDEIKCIMASEAEIRGISFRIEKNLMQDWLMGDTVRLQQVLLNLVSNALKFTGTGGTVRLQVSEDALTEKNVTLTVRVSDTGLGIAAEDRQRIFDSFEQVGPNTAKSQGTGLGLPISRHIVRMMGGELGLKSEPGAGSEFYFTVTLEKSFRDDTPKPSAMEENSLRDVHILLAEDNDLNAEIAMELLKMQGASVSRAENGRIALELFSSSKAGTFQVILMDLMMPEMNGLDAAQAIRSLSHPNAADIPIIAMTANTFKKDEEAAAAAGMTGFLPKPIDVEHLYQELRHALKKG